MFTYEKEYSHLEYISGIDEVGRGTLAGDVVACCVIMPKDKIIEGIKDSKKLTEKKRIFLAEKIKEVAICYSICQISNFEIDKINILEATKKAMISAVKSMEITPDILLIDAVKLDIDLPQVNIIKGDEKSYSIACASILAKVYRDELMCNLAKDYPNYAFEKNKGYGTSEHIENIKKYGICKIHRKTFVKKIIA